MPENVMLNHNYVMAEGGTGVRALLAAHMYLSAKAYAAGENGRTENWKFIYETMDAGAEEIEQLQKLVQSHKVGWPTLKKALCENGCTILTHRMGTKNYDVIVPPDSVED